MEQKIAEILIKIQAVIFVPTQPSTFKSGIISPVYVDNRKLPFHPKEWKIVLESFRDLIKQKNIDFDIVAGIETAGIPHSAGLGFILDKPSVFVRKQVKNHGTKSRIEGGSVQGKKVLLIEDLVSTGESSLNGVETLREEGAIVDNILAIVSYDFPESKKAFRQTRTNLFTLTSFPVILEEAKNSGLLTEDQVVIIKEWLNDPYNWGAKHNF